MVIIEESGDYIMTLTISYSTFYVNCCKLCILISNEQTRMTPKLSLHANTIAFSDRITFRIPKHNNCFKTWHTS